MLVQEDYALAECIYEITPAVSKRKIVHLLMNLFSHHNVIFQFLETKIAEEVSNTGNIE